MYLVLALLCSLASACLMTWVIFRLARVVGSWSGPRFALLCAAGAVIVIVLFGSVNRIPKKHETWSIPCAFAPEQGCRNGVYSSTLESDSEAGEVAKLGLITTALGTLFGIVMLTRLWLATDRAARPRS